MIETREKLAKRQALKKYETLFETEDDDDFISDTPQLRKKPTANNIALSVDQKTRKPSHQPVAEPEVCETRTSDLETNNTTKPVPVLRAATTTPPICEQSPDILESRIVQLKAQLLRKQKEKERQARESSKTTT